MRFRFFPRPGSLTVMQKLAVLTGLLFIPVIVLSVIAGHAGLQRMTVAKSESTGLAVMERVWPMMVDLGSDTAKPKMMQTLLAFDQAMQKGESAFDIREESRAFRLAYISFAQAQGPTRTAMRNEAMDAARTLMQKIADESQLARDPELRTYYISAMLTRQLPNLLQGVTDIHSTAQAAHAAPKLSFEMSYDLSAAISRVENEIWSLNDSVKHVLATTGHSQSAPADFSILPEQTFGQLIDYTRTRKIEMADLSSG